MTDLAPIREGRMEVLRDNSFHGQRLLRDGTWIVGFVAHWCGFCRRFLPEFSALPEEKAIHVGLGDVTSEESALWDDFGIAAVPTLIVFHDGKPVFRADSDLGVGLPPGSLDRARSAAREARA